MKKSLILVGMLSIGYAYSQEGNVGINTDQPKATLDIQPNADNAKVEAKTNQGIIAPRSVSGYPPYNKIYKYRVV